MIITCDDYGIHEDIDSSILDLCKSKKVNAVSIISCGKTFSSSIKYLSDYKDQISLGIHATWVGEKSILAHNKIPSIVSTGKDLNQDFRIFYLKWLMGLIELDHLKIELEEQILKLLDAIGSVNHIDSHQHIHMIPEIFGICIELAEKYNIPRIRIVDEYYPSSLPKIINPIRIVGEMLIRNWTIKNKAILKNYSIKTTEKFFGLRYSGNFGLIKDYISLLLKEQKSEDIEINFHPAFKSESLFIEYPWYSNGDIDYNLLLNN